MFTLIYLSTANHPMSDQELTDLMTECQENNACLNITGLLLYKDDHFLQFLEGDKQIVLNLYNEIAHDPRHSHVAVLQMNDTEHRYFSDWSMGFYNLNNEDDLNQLTHFSDQKIEFSEFRHDAPKAYQLLKQFSLTQATE